MYIHVSIAKANVLSVIVKYIPPLVEKYTFRLLYWQLFL